MLISGMQKLTLLDFPGKTAATIFTLGCNLRCPFCHNALLVTDIRDAELTPEDEVLSYLKKRAGILDGACITGGEPCLQTDLPDFIRKIKELGHPSRCSSRSCKRRTSRLCCNGYKKQPRKIRRSRRNFGL